MTTGVSASPATAVIQPGNLWRWALTNELTRPLVPILTCKALVFALVFLTTVFMPFNERNQQTGFNYPEPEGRISRAFTSWDSNHYLYLADHGYEKGILSNWFTPAYPMTVKGVAYVVGDTTVAALLVANLASLAGLYLLYLLTRDTFGSETAIKAVAVMAAFPTAFFLHMIYTEGLFLLLSAGFFFALQRRNYALAAALSFFLPATRLVGFAIIVPFAVFLMTEKRPLAWRREYAYLLAPIAGQLAYYAFMAYFAGSPFAASEIGPHVITDWSLKHVFDPLHLLGRFFTPDLEVHGMLNSGIDRAFFVAFLGSLPFVYRRTNPALFSWYVVLGLTPLLGEFMSYTRYLMVAFPLYIAVASWLTTRSPLATWRIVVYSSIFQAGFLALHVSNNWVA